VSGCCSTTDEDWDAVIGIHLRGQMQHLDGKWLINDIRPI
jgi:hypothetical protein